MAVSCLQDFATAVRTTGHSAPGGTRSRDRNARYSADGNTERQPFLAPEANALSS